MSNVSNVSSVKTCVTYAHFINSGSSVEFGQCGAIWRVKPRDNPVTGKRENGKHWLAGTQRMFVAECGPSGVMWRSTKPTKPKASSSPKTPNKRNILSRTVLRFIAFLRD